MTKKCTTLLGITLFTSLAFAQEKTTKYIRYSAQGRISYGILEGQTVRELQGDIFQRAQPSGKTLELSAVKLLAPCEPSQVIAIGLNYKSHLGNREPAKYPGVFLKLPTSIIGPGQEIILPDGASNVHYEAELVVVIGKEAKNISKK